MSNKKLDSKSKKKKKITFPKVMLILAICLCVGLIGFVIVDKVTSSSVKAISIEGAYSVLYVGNPKYDSVEHDVVVYPSNAKQGFTATSSDTKVATVSITDEGRIKVKAVGEGTAQIIVRSTAKTSIKDSFNVTVKNTDVQDVTIYDFNNEVVDVNTSQTINIQKDGLEHYIPFDIDPVDANIDRLQVLEFDKNALENVWIDAENKRLVVIPKTDIENKIVTVYLGIYQNTTKGQTPAKKIAIKISLTERTAYLKFAFAYDSTSGIKFSENQNTQNIVYLDPATDGEPIDDFYLKVKIAYDEAFTNIGEFKAEDFMLSVSDSSQIGGSTESNSFVAFDYSSTNDFAEYKDNNGKVIFKISKVNGGEYFKVEAGNGFKALETSSYKLTFIHKYTGDKGEVEVKYFEKNLLSDNGTITDWAIEIPTRLASTYALRPLELQQYRYAITNGSSVLLESNIDKGIEKGILSIYTVDKNGNECTEFKNEFEDTITIEKFDKRIKIKANSKISRTNTASDSKYDISVRFKFSATYWDDRYTSSYSILIANTNWREYKFAIDDFKEENDDDFKSVSFASTTALNFTNSIGDLSGGVNVEDVKFVSISADLTSSTKELKYVKEFGKTKYYVFKVGSNYYYLTISPTSQNGSFSVVINSATVTTTTGEGESVTTSITINDANITRTILDSDESIVDITKESTNIGKFQMTFSFYNLTKTIHFTVNS